MKSVNGALRSRQDAERLQGIADRIEAYDVVVRVFHTFKSFQVVSKKLSSSEKARMSPMNSL